MNITECNDAIRATVATFGDSYQHSDLPEPVRDAMTKLGLPAGFPFPVRSLSENWALVMVPEKRWRRLRGQFRRTTDYDAGGTEPRLHLFPLTRAARTVVLCSIYPGGVGYCPGEIILDPYAEGRGEENPVGLRFIEIMNQSELLARHERVAVAFAHNPETKL